MSNDVNLFTPLVDSLVDSGKIALKHIKKILGLNILDFNKLFEEIELYNKSKEKPKLYDIENKEYYKKYIFECPIGITDEDFKKNSYKIAIFIGADVNSIRIEQDKYYINIRVIIKRPTGEYDPLTMKRKDFKIPLGYSLDTMEMVYWDVIKASNTHCYIAGSSGGGKSVKLRLILSHLVNSKSKRDIEFSIINTKRVDLKDFKDCKHTINYMSGIEGVEEFLEAELDEMERRYILIDKNNCDDLTEFREKVYKIPYRLIVIEEISSYKNNKEYQRAIELIASQGRGAGMILLLVTQLPSHEIMPNTIKCNINTTIGLMTKDSIRSEIIAGPDAGLEKLKGNGHAKLFDRAHDGEEYQGLNISKEIMKEIIKANAKQNKRAIDAGTSITPGDNKNIEK
ncbi:FtsK/SpoIIIE domain-containing protein [Romboutsia ilealis]|uniref:FtsK/SpoIIIE domain-containing protein n=1 Tax=Romboutsia ilealis TaxID=1115758 RepID=UPI0027312AB6|nr:FtsK/SpoIIIE domain-containing protein [Romboutsia ilealis]